MNPLPNSLGVGSSGINMMPNAQTLQQEAAKQHYANTLKQDDVVEISVPDEVYISSFKYSNETLERDFSLIKRMDLLDDESLDVIYSYFAGFKTENKRWMFNFITGMYAEKYEDLMKKYSGLFSWVCFNVAIILYKSESTLADFNTTVFSGITVNNINVSKRKRLTVGRTVSNPVIKSTINDDSPKPQHPIFDEAIYRRNAIVFNISLALKYNIPSDFAALHAVHGRSSQKIQLQGGTTATVPCVKIDIVPAMVCNFMVSKVPYQFNNFKNDELVNFIEHLYGGDVKLSYGLKVGNRKDTSNTRRETLDVLEADDSKKDQALRYSLIKSIVSFVDSSKHEAFIGMRCYTDYDVYIPQQIIMERSAMDVVEANFDDAEITKYARKIDAFRRSVDVQATAATISNDEVDAKRQKH